LPLFISSYTHYLSIPQVLLPLVLRSARPPKSTLDIPSRSAAQYSKSGRCSCICHSIRADGLGTHSNRTHPSALPSKPLPPPHRLASIPTAHIRVPFLRRKLENRVLRGCPPAHTRGVDRLRRSDVSDRHYELTSGSNDARRGPQISPDK
jgi:hypothetical protein